MENTANNTQISQNNESIPAIQPKVIFTGTQTKRQWWKYLFGCFGVLLLCAAPILACLVPSLLLGNLGSQFSAGNFGGIAERPLYNIGEDEKADKAKLAVINISGEIFYSIPGTPEFEGATSNNINAQLQKAMEDKDVKAVVLRFNTPGGEVTAAEPICRQIKTLADEKPVYSFIDSAGASLGYLLANCTDYIYARPSAMTGSIGVIIQAIDFYGILEHFGGKVTFITNTEGKQKSGEDIFDENSETYKTYQKLLDETYEYFINVVYDGRRQNQKTITKEDIKRLADGRIFSGRQAKDLRLIDELGEFDQALESIISKESTLDKKNIDVIEYELPMNPFSGLFGGLKVNVGSVSLDSSNKPEPQQGIKLLMLSGVSKSSK